MQERKNTVYYSAVHVYTTNRSLHKSPLPKEQKTVRVWCTFVLLLLYIFICYLVFFVFVCLFFCQWKKSCPYKNNKIGRARTPHIHIPFLSVEYCELNVRTDNGIVDGDVFWLCFQLCMSTL